MEFATRTEYILFYMAAVSSGLFIIKILLMFIGGDFDSHDVDFSSADAGDSDGDFGVFSTNALLCFFMGLGWFGLAAFKEWGFTRVPALGIGLLAGVLCSLFFSILLGFAKKLNATPEPASIKKDSLGQVYSRIPAHGIGKINVDNKIVNATSDTTLESFQRIKVLEDVVIDPNSVVKVTSL